MSDRPAVQAERMTFGEHLDALRPHLVRSAAVVFALMLIAFCCKRLLVDGLLLGPLSEDFPANRLLQRLAAASGLDEGLFGQSRLQLVSTTMAGQFNLHLKISFIAALTLGFPYVVWELWRFIRPALTPREQRGCRRLVGCIALGFFAGLAFGYLLIAPLTVGFLARYRVSAAVANMIDAGSYLSTVVNVSLACALLFQLPLLVHTLTRTGLLTPEWLRRYRRHAILVLALLAALITPPDAASMVLVLLPLYGLYELSIRIAARTRRRMERTAGSDTAGSDTAGSDTAGSDTTGNDTTGSDTAAAPGI